MPISLKTRADQGIKENEIHISKFMELGKGQWGRNVADLTGLRAQFFVHMASYERILTQRYLGRAATDHRYELVEIPKALFAGRRGTARDE